MSKDDDLIIKPPNGEVRDDEPKVPEVTNDQMEQIAREALASIQQTVRQVVSANLNRLDVQIVLALAEKQAQAVTALALARLCKYAEIEGLDGQGGHPRKEA